MAIAKKCDRCGEFYTQKEKTAIDYAVQNILDLTKTETLINFELLTKNLDFCAECKKSLIKWFKNIKSEVEGE